MTEQISEEIDGMLSQRGLELKARLDQQFLEALGACLVYVQVENRRALVKELVTFNQNEHVMGGVVDRAFAGALGSLAAELEKAGFMPSTTTEEVVSDDTADDAE